MEEFVTKSLLFDFYGELLTEHQKKIYQAVVFEDLSVSEVAQEEGITRQGVHDLMRRCERLLEEYEDKLHLVERFQRIRSQVKTVQELADPARERTEDELHQDLQKIDATAVAILEEL